MGPAGAGKSTLVNVILGKFKPSSGFIQVTRISPGEDPIPVTHYRYSIS